MTEYVRLENIKLGMVMANEQIDKTINKELSRTIATLNNFVDNFNQQTTKVRENKKASRMVKGVLTLSDAQRRSMVTRMSSSNSPPSPITRDDHIKIAKSPLTAMDQLRSLTAKIQASSLDMENEINELSPKKELHRLEIKSRNGSLATGARS